MQDKFHFTYFTFLAVSLFEKEYESTKSMLSEVVDEKSRLTGKTVEL